MPHRRGIVATLTIPRIGSIFLGSMEFDTSPRVVFDDAALDYDRYRPGYPDEAIAALIDLSGIEPGSRLLEVGCGTGQATMPVARRGFGIDAVELGPNLAAIAARKLAPWPRVRVAVGSYEDYEPPEADYDLIYSAQAFHWIDPGVRLAKSARLLKRDRCLALLYNCTPRLDGALALLSERLRALTGSPIGTPQMTLDMERWKTELAESGLFGDIALREYPWSRRYGAEEYRGLFRTYSDFRGLDEDIRAKAAEAIEWTIVEAGGGVERDYVCTLIHARKARKSE
jgi:SAM-dependent methyltransferase